MPGTELDWAQHSKGNRHYTHNRARKGLSGRGPGRVRGSRPWPDRRPARTERHDTAAAALAQEQAKQTPKIAALAANESYGSLRASAGETMRPIKAFGEGQTDSLVVYNLRARAGLGGKAAVGAIIKSKPLGNATPQACAGVANRALRAGLRRLGRRGYIANGSSLHQ